MKTYSESQLKEMAKGAFEANPEADKLLATSDGQFFLEKGANAAQFHAKQRGGVKTPLKIYTIERVAPAPAKGDETDPAEMTIKEITAHVATIEDVEVLQLLFEVVTSKGGKEAIQARIDNLTAQD